jgi:cyanophycin synthetase
MGNVTRRTPAELIELRVLDGPNLYFPRPAIKVTVAVPGWLRATTARLRRIADAVEAPATLEPGDPRTFQRRRFAAGIGQHVTRRLAREAGIRLGVRGRPGPDDDLIVVSYPWRHRGSAEALGCEVPTLLSDLLATRRSFATLVAGAAARVREADPGDPPSVPAPTIPVVAVTGTNGKTTTVRLLAHLVRTAGRRVAYSSTDGVYLDGDLVEGGDYSGFAGAAMALAQPGVEVAVLETARGGILLRGIGTTHNDVAVVTNVSSDHLGLHGIDSLDELAEVKAAITRITRPEGWCVLNAEDPRVLSMRRRAQGRPCVFAVDPQHPAIRDALAEGGRAITVLDDQMVVFERRGGVRPLVSLRDLPVALAGIATHQVQNAMAATGAALGIGLSDDAIVRGLTSFVQDPVTNPGRANVFVLGERVIVVDYAHNEAGMLGFAEIVGGLRPKGAEIWLAICTAGDRQDEVIHALGYRAARGADHVLIAELPHYLRGREPQDIVARLRAGAVDGGVTDVPALPDEVHALELMLERSGPRDVLGLAALGQRPEVFALLTARGATLADPATVRRLVDRARR